MLLPLPATALPESVTTVPVVTVEGMLPKVTTGDGIADEGCTAISAWYASSSPAPHMFKFAVCVQIVLAGNGRAEDCK
jgi:hypothetical protein